MTSRIRYTFALLNSKESNFVCRAALLFYGSRESFRFRSVKQMYARAKLKLQ